MTTTNPTPDLLDIILGGKPYVVAELSANHLLDLARARELIREAKMAGASAVKLQTFRPQDMILNLDRPEFYIKGGQWDGKHLFELYREAQTPWVWHEELFQWADALDIDIFSSPFSPAAVDLLEDLDCPAYKVASFELVDLHLIDYIAQTGKPIILSTGMASFDDVKRARKTVAHYHDRYLFLHCVSGYPTPVAQAKLGRMKLLANQLAEPLGLSDHSPGHAVACAAVAMGAPLIEKHLTLSRKDGGLDAAFSMEPKEFAAMVQAVHGVWEALQQTDEVPAERYTQFRRALYVVEDMEEGEEFTHANVRSIRGRLGLPPHLLGGIVGKRARRKLEAGTPMSEDLYE